MAHLTPREIDAALTQAAREKREIWLPDGDARGEGRLLLRATPRGGRWMFRYTVARGKRDTLPMGLFASPRTKEEPTGAAYSLREARAKATEWAALLKDPRTRDIRAHLERQAVQAELESQNARDISQHTLEALLGAYCDYLDTRGRKSASNVREELNRHVVFAHPAIASRPACEVTLGEITLIVRKLVEAKKTRSAGLIRSYLLAAYNLALGAEANPEAPAALVPFRVTVNPVAAIKALPVNERHRVLTERELRAVLKHLDADPSLTAKALKLCILTGGQRPQQFIRATRADFDADSGILRLIDWKGRRRAPREHFLPLGEQAASIVADLAKRAENMRSDLLFSSDGKVGMTRSTPSSYVTDLSKELAESGRGSYQLKDLRRTAETMLAAMGIHRDIRGQIQSHGLSGVQNQRYDRHDYLKEKRATLQAWEERLSEMSAKDSTPSLAMASEIEVRLLTAIPLVHS